MTVIWFIDKVPVDGLTQFFTLKNGSLQTSETTESDEAVYYCEGTNSLGFIESPNITVTLASMYQCQLPHTLI